MPRRFLIASLALPLLACDDAATGEPSPAQIVIVDGGSTPDTGPLVPLDQGVAPERDARVDPTPDARVPRADARVQDPDRGVVGPEPDRGVVEPDPDQGVIEPEPDQGVDPELPPDPGVNAGWIGGPCAADADCDYDEAFCLQSIEGYPRGMCSLGCDRVCPDRDGMPVTFCVDDIVVGSGACVQRCDADAFGGDGCRPGYFCDVRARYSEPGVQRGVCVPGERPPPPACIGDLEARGLRYTPAENPLSHPDGRPDLTCDIDTPIRLSSPINGVSYRYVTHDDAQPIFMACPLADALWDLSEMLHEFDVVEVGHIGVYNCRLIGGTDSISEHGYARAIDLKWFRTSDGTVYDVEDHWEHDTVDFRTEAGRVLYEISQQMFQRRVFNIILTPNYNAAHDNHFHVDLTPGARFIGSADTFEAQFGVNPHGD